MARGAAASAGSVYAVHPSVALLQKWVAGLKEKTGRTQEEWLALIKKDGPKGEKARLDWLKSKHKLGTNWASWLAELAEGKTSEFSGPEAYLQAAVQYVESQYSGAKAGLRPVYDELLAIGKSLGDDVKVCPCRTIVPFYRQHVFAQIKATTNSRVDLGLCLTAYKEKLPKRVIDTGGAAKKDRITHRIEIKDAGEIDGDVRKWLKVAYELDG